MAETFCFDINSYEYTSFIISYLTSCVLDYPPTYLVCLHNGDDTR